MSVGQRKCRSVQTQAQVVVAITQCVLAAPMHTWVLAQASPKTRAVLSGSVVNRTFFEFRVQNSGRSLSSVNCTRGSTGMCVSA